MLKLAFLATLTIICAKPATAQHVPSYAGLEHREIKALSAEQIADLRAGRGMGMALPAELNGFPGPLHVLELADRLDLSFEQRSRTRELFESMKTESIIIGEQLIREEAELDRQFASKAVTSQALVASVAAIGATQAKLRHAHLKYHLSTAAVLTPHQVKRYSELRGYSGTDKSHGHSHN